MTPQEVKVKLKEDKEFLVGSLISLYRLQTEDEKASKSTARRNNVGFNGTDARFLSDISEYYLKRGFLTDKQMRIVRPKLAKYSKQIAEIDPEPMSTGWRSGNLKKKKKPTKRTAEVYDEEWKHIKIVFPYDQGLIHYIKGINGYRFCPERDYGENFWTIPLTIINVDRLLEKEFELSEELNKWYSNQINGVTSDISVPGLDHILRPFQKEAVSYTDSRGGRVLIADDMGLGKTLEAIAWIQLHGENVLPAIIVCPASLKTNWMKEIRKFTDLGNKVEVLDGFDTHKITKPIVVVNYDILPQRTEKIKNKDGSESSRKVPDTGWAKYLLKNVNPKLIVADEVHKAKNKDAKRTQSLGHLAKYTKYFIGLTGTPIENKPKEIFQPLQMIKPTLFPSFRAFATRYCNAHRDRYGRLNTDGASNTIELNQVLTRECFAYNTTITLEKNGQKPIGEVVENEINDRVLSYDFETSEIQWRQIEAHAASTKPNKLVRIKHESGEFTCTPDHPIWTEEKGYVRAEEITPDLSLLVLQDTEDSNS